MSTIRFPKSNAIPVTRVEDYDLLQTDTTRNFPDFVYQSITNTCYYIQIRQSDNLWLQYRTDYIGKAAYLIDDLGNETDVTGNISEVTTSTPLTNNRKQYKLSLNLKLITGYYYLRFDFNQDEGKPEATFRSEWFNIQTSFDNALFVEWSNYGDIATNADGIIWEDETQKMWINSRLSDYQPGLDASVLITATGKQITTQSTPFKTKIWQVAPIPAFAVETINIARGKYTFKINGEKFSAVENLDTERLGDITEYPFEMPLRLIETVQGDGYEDYTEDQELTGDIVPITDSYLLINDSGDRLLINSTDYLFTSEA